MVVSSSFADMSTGILTLIYFYQFTKQIKSWLTQDSNINTWFAILNRVFVWILQAFLTNTDVTCLYRLNLKEQTDLK